MTEPRQTDNPTSVHWAWASTVVCIMAFAALSLLVSSNHAFELDRSVLLWFRAADGTGIGPEWFEESVSDITALGSYPTIMLALTFILCGLALSRHYAISLFLLLAIVTGSAASTVLKLIFLRDRPDLVEQLDRTFTASFPSGHAMLSMLAWLTMAAVVSRFLPAARLRYLTIVSAIILSLMIGTSRVYLGVHWPTDVLAGWLAGVGWASGCWLVAHYLAQHDRKTGRFGQSVDPSS